MQVVDIICNQLVFTINLTLSYHSFEFSIKILGNYQENKDIQIHLNNIDSDRKFRNTIIFLHVHVSTTHKMLHVCVSKTKIHDKQSYTSKSSV